MTKAQKFLERNGLSWEGYDDDGVPGLTTENIQRIFENHRSKIDMTQTKHNKELLTYYLEREGFLEVVDEEKFYKKIGAQKEKRKFPKELFKEMQIEYYLDSKIGGEIKYMYGPIEEEGTENLKKIMATHIPGWELKSLFEGEEMVEKTLGQITAECWEWVDYINDLGVVKLLEQEFLPLLGEEINKIWLSQQ